MNQGNKFLTIRAWRYIKSLGARTSAVVARMGGWGHVCGGRDVCVEAWMLRGAPGWDFPALIPRHQPPPRPRCCLWLSTPCPTPTCKVGVSRQLLHLTRHRCVTTLFYCHCRDWALQSCQPQRNTTV